MFFHNSVKTHPIGIGMRFACVLATAGLVTGANGSLRIISPESRGVVKPGQQLVVRVAGNGKYSMLVVVGSDAVGAAELAPPIGKPPWEITVDVSLDSPLGMQSITVLGYRERGAEPEESTIDVDVEPVVIPRLEFDPPNLEIIQGGCFDLANGKGSGGCGRTLFVSGVYPDGTTVDVTQSTRLKIISRNPSIVKVLGCCLLAGVSPGSTKLVFFDKYPIDVTVRRGGR